MKKDFFPTISSPNKPTNTLPCVFNNKVGIQGPGKGTGAEEARGEEKAEEEGGSKEEELF